MCTHTASRTLLRLRFAVGWKIIDPARWPIREHDAYVVAVGEINITHVATPHRIRMKRCRSSLLSTYLPTPRYWLPRQGAVHSVSPLAHDEGGIRHQSNRPAWLQRSTIRQILLGPHNRTLTLGNDIGTSYSQLDSESDLDSWPP